MRFGISFTTDEGAYALQARTLAKGTWSYDYPAENYDPTGRHFPIVHSLHSDRGWFPYVKHPLYPVLLWLSSRVFGDRLGLYVPSIVGAVGTAVTAWLIASELEQRRTQLAFWIAGLSPVFVNAFIIWAHTLSAAASGLSVWLVLRAHRRNGGRAGLLVAVGAVAAVGAMLRSEGVLFSLALGGTVLLAGIRSRSRRLAVVGLFPLAGAIIGTAADEAWRRAIVGRPVGEALRSRGAGLLDRLEGIRNVLVGSYVDNPRAGLLATLAMGVLIVGVLLWRGSRITGREALLIVLTVGLLWSVRLVIYPRELTTGILSAWPSLVVGLGLLECRRRTNASLLLGVIGLFAVAVLLTQYPGGAGPEWGGRYLSPAAGPLAALLAMGLGSWPQSGRAIAKRELRVISAVLIVLPAMAGVIAVTMTRKRVEEVVRAVMIPRSTVLISMHPHLPRIAWSNENIVWLVVQPSEDPNILLRTLARKGVASVTVYAPAHVNIEAAEYGDVRISPAIAGPERWRIIVLRGRREGSP